MILKDLGGFTTIRDELRLASYNHQRSPFSRQDAYLIPVSQEFVVALVSRGKRCGKAGAIWIGIQQTSAVQWINLIPVRARSCGFCTEKRH
jgi:hypothetical protein